MKAAIWLEPINSVGQGRRGAAEWFRVPVVCSQGHYEAYRYFYIAAHAVVAEPWHIRAKIDRSEHSWPLDWHIAMPVADADHCIMSGNVRDSLAA